MDVLNLSDDNTSVALDDDGQKEEEEEEEKKITSTRYTWQGFRPLNGRNDKLWPSLIVPETARDNNGLALNRTQFEISVLVMIYRTRETRYGFKYWRCDTNPDYPKNPTNPDSGFLNPKIRVSSPEIRSFPYCQF